MPAHVVESLGQVLTCSSYVVTRWLHVHAHMSIVFSVISHNQSLLWRISGDAALSSWLLWPSDLSCARALLAGLCTVMPAATSCKRLPLSDAEFVLGLKRVNCWVH